MSTWSGIRAKLENDYLAPSLRGRIQYFATTYSKCPDHEGRAAVRLDGEEILKSSYFEKMIAHSREFHKLYEGTGKSYGECWMQAFDEAVNAGEFDQRVFYRAFEEYDNQSIEQSLESTCPIVRLFAILDRRVGKRRLIKLRERISDELDWLKPFYLLRFEAEGISYKEVTE
ncbi:MAG: hypothetical protein IJZ47_09470 [Oscillospiraceae bacterium]|nr:hypothetical protein [Oscillospiraceae bacterium]